MMLAGLQFLPAYMIYQNRPMDFYWLFPFTFVVAISLYGELYNELRDLEGDLKAGLRHTAILLGARRSYGLMMLILSIGAYCGFVTIFLMGIIPTWVVWVLIGAALGLYLLPMYHPRRRRIAYALHESFQKPIEIAGAIALGAHFAGPWAWAAISPWAIMLIRLKLF